MKIEKIKSLLKCLKIQFNSLEIYVQALTHRSFDSQKNNERLEFLGDSILNFIISEKLVSTYLDKKEGELTSLRAALVKTESLAEECKRIGLNRCILLSKSEIKDGGYEKMHILAGAFEAFIGALYFDQGLERCVLFIEQNVFYKVDSVIRTKSNINPKTLLQEIIQEKYKLTPEYELINVEGPDHNRTFTVAVVIRGKQYKVGKGKSKQAAEVQAAHETLKFLSLREYSLD